jgi:hypothetical protein
VRKLNVDFAGTALEEALMLKAKAQLDSSATSDNASLLNNIVQVNENSLEENKGLKFAPTDITLSNELIKENTRKDQLDLNVDDKKDQVDLNPVDPLNRIPETSSKYTDYIIHTQLVNNLVDKQLSCSNQVDKQPSQLSTKLVDTQVGTLLLEKDNFQDSQLSTKLFNDQLPGYKTPNILDDEIMPNLIPSEQVILRRLFRLSYGFNRIITDPVSYSKLSEKCHLGLSAVKDALKSLQMKNLIKAIGDNKHSPIGGNRYLLNLPLPNPSTEFKNENKDSQLSTKLVSNLVNKQPSYYATKSVNGYIKDHDHDLKITNHHQNETMMIYRNLTGNKSWTKSDTAAYEKIKHLSLEEITVLIKSTLEKAHQRPASLAYFVKAHQNPSQANPANRQAIKAKIAAIVERKREAHVGTKYTISDLSYDVKAECIRENIVFDNEIFNEVLENQKG